MKSLLSTILPLSTAAFMAEPLGLPKRPLHEQHPHPSHPPRVLHVAGGNDWDDNISVDLDIPPPLSPRKEIVMSPAIPFLECPSVLVDCDLAGNVGFDPLGLAKTKDDLLHYREAEVKHARLAMLAAVGWPISELLDRKIALYFGLDTLLDAYDRAPSLLNGGLERVSPVWWGTCLGLTAAIDLDGIAKARAGDPDYFPGKFDFDPLNLYPKDLAGRARMELAEIKHGRLAMIAVAAFAFQEYATNLGVIDETPFFFFPLNESLERMGLM